MNIPERITRLRALMNEKHIDAYIIPSADNHQSEYVGDHFKSRAFITGFTGSAGTAVITKEEVGLWTDGRYFLQAEQQLVGSGITLFKMGNPGVPTTEDYLANVLPVNGTLGFDGRLIAMEEGNQLANVLARKNVSINYDFDLVDVIWENRPELADEPVFALDVKYSGESTSAKLTKLRATMRDMKATVHIITSLDDIGWLLNIRGNDVEYSPLILSYAIITMDKVDLFIKESKLNDTIKSSLKKDGVIFHPYNAIYEEVKKFNSNDILLIDPAKINYALYNNISLDVTKIEKANPTILFKAMKNEVELANIRNAHIKDGVAHTKFIYWLKENIGKIKITEMSASDKLEEFRAAQDGFLWPSFEPICAFREHAAIVHYTSSPETDLELESGYLFLSDTGGNYYEGSTDITRTIALGEISKEQKAHFTMVARSNLNLAHTRFLYGCCGYNLDIIARQPFWDMNLNYNHGTGHGIGYLLNIHEGPTGFRWQMRAHEAHPFEEGMVITDEPGIYISDSHGIRTENELIVRKGEANEYGQFMYFEPVTFVPIDLDALLPELMAPSEKEFLNSYHKKVYDLIAPHLTTDEKAWLKHNTRAI
ncbi:MAG: aminopeptidase P family N-terminal domain-containing protein [Lachnospiraceae bacterium]|nr:aminopeptidase P family N-terminal domain-containing protein [Lachnospiraceae bacterium]